MSPRSCRRPQIDCPHMRIGANFLRRAARDDGALMQHEHVVGVGEDGIHIVFGEQHMDHIVSEALAYYHEERPHQAKENVPLAPAKPSKSRKTGKRKKDQSPPDAVPVSQIECRQRLGGLLKHYSRKAA